MVYNDCWHWNKEISHEICQKLINLGKGNWNQAAIVDKSIDTVRKSDIVWTKEQWAYDLISPYMFSANEQAGWKYNIVAAQDCQVTRYTKDGFYGWHLDGMGSHTDLDGEGTTRKLSMSVILNSDYEGGDFEMRDLESKIPRLEEGSIIVFPSFIEHQVTPVTKGTRYSLVLWSLGKPFK